MVDAVTQAGSAAAGSANSRAALAQNFDTFLLLLTEQLKNQDPLSPLDSNEFVNQLVQFSGVEQAITQNDKLDALVGLQIANVAGATVSYLGKEARVRSDTAPLGPDGAHWAYTVDGEAETVSIAIKDAEGKVVFETEGEVGAGEQDFVWDGRDAAGALLPEGAYTLDIGAVDAEGDAAPISISAFGIVTGVDLSGTEPILVMGDARAAFASVEAVSERPAPATATGGTA